jgi:DNA-binding protein HU-beta
MYTPELTTAIADRAGLSQTVARKLIDILAEVVQEELASGQEITLPGIGKLFVRERDGRTGRSPFNGQPIDIPAKRLPAFKSAKKLREAIPQPEPGKRLGDELNPQPQPAISEYQDGQVVRAGSGR